VFADPVYQGYLATAFFGHYFLFRHRSARTVPVQAQQNIRPDNLTGRAIPFFGYFPEPFPFGFREPDMIFHPLHFITHSLPYRPYNTPFSYYKLFSVTFSMSHCADYTLSIL
jgi:hypothetical protein